MGPARVFLFAGLREERAEAPARLEASECRPGAESWRSAGLRVVPGLRAAGCLWREGGPQVSCKEAALACVCSALAGDGERGLEGRAGGDALAILVLLESFISEMLLENSQWSLSTNLFASSRCDGRGTRHVSLR